MIQSKPDELPILFGMTVFTSSVRSLTHGAASCHGDCHDRSSLLNSSSQSIKAAQQVVEIADRLIIASLFVRLTPLFSTIQ